MNDWTRSAEHPGYRCKTITRGSCTVTVFRPELEPEEKRRREEHFKTVAENSLKKLINRKEKKA